MKTKNSYQNLNTVGILWLALSGFYITGITKYSPVYISFFLAIIYTTYLFFQRKKVYWPFLLFIFITLLFIPAIYNSTVSTSINLLISFYSPVLCAVLFYKKKISPSILLAIFLSYAILLSSDGIWRLFNPDLTHVEQLSKLGVLFQIYKSNSFMYIDSNYVGLESIIIISSFIYLFKDYRLVGKIKILYIIVILLLILSCALTFSRAAILSLLFLFLVYFIFKLNMKYIFAILPICIVSLSGLIYYKFSTDISFGSKFYIIEITYDFIVNSWDSHLLFGVGIGNTVNYLGIGAHNLAITYLIETGIVGFSAFIFSMLFFLFSLKRDFFIVIIPFLLTSMSLGTTAIPYFFTFSCLCVLKKLDLFKIEFK
ncbi:O-antigen ligase family protein [Morganella morganii subsp. morganii]|uniref:O-antigen ligase family protein n=1 Tax=Morganella morganii TaxID=582 RepID=UPI001BDAD293|nr:O-antigen ligase family protein [Morganella morganii]MBT0395899.1 O-antigen ligase family protein [Morganella morganii subsp. morganii]